MILWCDGGHGAQENMRRDGALLDAAAAGRLPGPVLRVFAFVPAGITLGRSQVPGHELDLERVARDGVEWAVRPTGGRAIFHEHEWTFSLATTLGPGGWAGDGPSAYARTCGLLLRALRALGVPAELSAGSPRGVGPPRGADAPAAPCFASTARHELTLGGRKLAGIAQRDVHRALLQQGSVLVGAGHLRLADYLAVAPGAREALRGALAGAAAHAGDYLKPGAALADLADALGRELPGAGRVEAEHGLGLLVA